MAENEQPDHNEAGKEAKSYAKYTGIIFQMIAIIAVFSIAGRFLDNKYHNTTPLITALSCLIGVCLSLVLIVRQLKQ
jgi:F0F1-type ATP synthase assembly protein I